MKKESKFINEISKYHAVQYRKELPKDYHCTCEYCQNFLGEIYNNDENKYYSNRIRKKYYLDGAGDHLDVGQIIGYRWAIQNLTNSGDWILDPTVGSGTSIVEAINNKRNAIGIELEYPKIAEKNIKNQFNFLDQHIGNYKFRQGNALYIDNYLEEWGVKENSLAMIINGTPYPKLSGKSSDAPERKNLKNKTDKSFDYNHKDNFGLKKGEEYWNLISTMYTKSIKYLKNDGYFVIIIKDLVQNKEPYLLHKFIIDKVIEENPFMKPYGFFLNLHCPPTMFINTYNKRFPNIKIPLYQTGIVLQKSKFI